MRKSSWKRITVTAAMLALIVSVAFGTVAMAAGTRAPKGGPMDKDGDKIFDELEKIMDKAADDKGIPIIAVFDKTTAPEELTGEVGEFKVNQTYENFPFLAMDLNRGQIKKLARLPFVVHVEYDRPVYALMNTATNWFGVAKARTDWGVTGDGNGNETSYTKDDIVIAVIDTGIDPNHVDLDGGKIIGWKDYINSRTTPYDDNGHGTHCSGIAAGTGDGNSIYRGVAPGAALVGVKVLNSSGSGSTSTITSAVDWVVSNKSTYGIEIISMSLGSAGSSDGTDSLCVALNNATAAGIVCCVAAGNEGPARYTIGSPAAAANVITVGAMADVGENGYSLAYFSSRGPTADGRIKPDIASPGVNIMAPQAGTTSSYVSYSGTSMATPFTAGTVALMLDANPSMTPAQVKSTLQSTAIDWCSAGNDNEFGAGRLDGYAAVKAAGSYTGTGPTVPAHSFFSGSLASGGTANHTINVTSTSYPIACTLIMTNWSSSTSPNFNLAILNPSGSTVASGTGTTRQETVSYTPTVTGTYTLRVTSSSGSGPYTLDVSAGTGGGTDNPPTCSIANPASGETVSGTYTVRVQASDDIGVNKVEVNIDGGTWYDITSSLSGGYYSWSWNTTGYANGTHTVNARATDTIGQTGTDAHSCTVSNGGGDAPPTCSIANPTSGETVSGTYTVRVQASDDIGVNKVEVNIDGGTWYDITSSLSGGYYSWSWNTAGYANGTHTVNARATDTIGQTGTDSHSCTVSNVAPPSGQHILTFTDTVSSSSRTKNFYFNVNSLGYIYSTLSWGTSADLDLYIYSPSGVLIGSAAGTSRPEKLRTFTESYGTGQYRARVYYYSGSSSTNFTLTIEGYEKKTYTGTVDYWYYDSYEYVQFDYTGVSLFRLSWAGYDDLDLYIYDPLENYHAQAATLANPEQVYVTIDETGEWIADIYLYDGIEDDYVLEVYVPEDNLSQ